MSGQPIHHQTEVWWFNGRLKMKILLIEDSKKFSDLVKKGLENEGYTVDCVYDGQDGKNRIKLCESEYDLIILDIMLPKIDGITVCKSIRKGKIDTPVLMLTAKDATEDKIIGLDSGADDYLIKPFEFNELLARIRALLRRPKTFLPIPRMTLELHLV